MLSSSIRIVEVTLAALLCAIMFDQWASHGVYFHAFDSTFRAAARPFGG